MFLGEPAFVFALQVEAIRHRIVEGLAAGFQQLHRLGVADALKGTARHKFQPLAQTLVDEFLEDRQIALVLLKRLPNQVFDQRFGQVHIAGQVAEGHLRFDHPELCGVPRGVGGFGAEGRAEGVNVR